MNIFPFLKEKIRECFLQKRKLLPANLLSVLPDEPLFPGDPATLRLRLSKIRAKFPKGI